jgi:hypothetical protein
MGQNPGHDGARVGARGHYRGALDHLAAGMVRTGQPRHQGEDRVIVHC